MTRFKELRRIEAAIEHQNTAELSWALGLLQDEARDSFTKEHLKYWRQMERKVRQALEDSN